MINVFVDGIKIICKKDINIGMVVVLLSGNLIVLVIKKVDYLSLIGLIKFVNDFVGCVCNNKLKLEEI